MIMMTEIETLYEHIYCSEYGAEYRAELIEKHRDRLPELAEEHKRSGMKVNSVSLPFDRKTGEIAFDDPSWHEAQVVSEGSFTIAWGAIVKYALWTIALILLWRMGT